MGNLSKIALFLLALIVGAPILVAQAPTHPKLTTTDKPSDTASKLFTDGKTYYFVESNPIDRDLPLQPNTMMAVYTDRELTTKRMKETDMQTLTVLSLGEVSGRFAKYVELGSYVTIGFRGRSAGFVRQSYIEVDIQNVIVQLNKYTKVGERNGFDVLLSPGVYRLTLVGGLRNFQFPGLFNYNVPAEGGQRIKRGFWGSGGSSSVCEDRLNPLNPLNPLSNSSLPFFAVCGIAKLVKIGLRRPDWNLPAQTLLTFDIDRIKATRLQGIPLEAGTLTPVTSQK